jgi:hypothetical protein
MKRIIFIVSLVILTTLVCGCTQPTSPGGQVTPTQTSVQSATTSAQPQSTEGALTAFEQAIEKAKLIYDEGVMLSINASNEAFYANWDQSTELYGQARAKLAQAKDAYNVASQSGGTTIDSQYANLNVQAIVLYEQAMEYDVKLMEESRLMVQLINNSTTLYDQSSEQDQKAEELNIPDDLKENPKPAIKSDQPQVTEGALKAFDQAKTLYDEGVTLSLDASDQAFNESWDQATQLYDQAKVKLAQSKIAYKEASQSFTNPVDIQYADLKVQAITLYEQAMEYDLKLIVKSRLMVQLIDNSTTLYDQSSELGRKAEELYLPIELRETPAPTK